MILNEIKSFFIGFDIISEEIKFFSIFETKGRYKTLFGGVLSFVTYCLCITASVYFSMQIITKTDPRTYQSTEYVDIAPRITFDSKNLFFILYFWSEETNLVNSSFITLTATQATIKENVIVNEYTFGKCRLKEDLDEIYDILKDFGSDVLENSFCIQNMVVNGTLIPKNDSNFIYPYTDYGMESKAEDPINLQIFGMRCVNSTENNNSCLPSTEIDNLIKNSEYRLMLIDNYFNPLDYWHPIIRFAQRIVGGTTVGMTSNNYINFDNVKIKTNDGLIFDNFHTVDSYKLQNNVEIVQKQDTVEDPIFILTIEGENSAYNIERHYIKVQEVLASIGGVFKCLFLFASIINFSYNKLMIKRNFLKKIYSNFISLNKAKPDDFFFFKAKRRDEIPEENQLPFVKGEPRLERDYYGNYSKNIKIFNNE